MASSDASRDEGQPRARRVYEATVIESSGEESDSSDEDIRRRPVFDGEILDGDAPLVLAIEVHHCPCEQRERS